MIPWCWDHMSIYARGTQEQKCSDAHVRHRNADALTLMSVARGLAAQRAVRANHQPDDLNLDAIAVVIVQGQRLDPEGIV